MPGKMAPPRSADFFPTTVIVVAEPKSKTAVGRPLLQLIPATAFAILSAPSLNGSFTLKVRPLLMPALTYSGRFLQKEASGLFIAAFRAGTTEATIAEMDLGMFSVCVSFII